MAIDYTTIHLAIKTLILANVAGKFRYVPADKAVNLELGEYPSGLRNKGVMIRLAEQDESKFEDADRHRTQWEIQFTLNAKSDAYLAKLVNCVASVKSLEGLKSSDFATYRGSDINEHIFGTFPMGELMLVTFSDIYIEIEG